MERKQEGGLSIMAGKFTATIDGNSFKIVLLSDQKVEIDGNAHRYNLAELNGRGFSLILDGKSYIVETLPSSEACQDGDTSSEGDPRHSLPLSIKGTRYLVSVDDEHSLLVKSLSAKPESEKGAQVVRAPMPGLISRIEVQVGEEVVSGSGLLVLEAMKMENEIRSLKHGTIQIIHVEKGRAVEKGEPLITIAER
jgi:pyruvate carboxylase subunit B